MLVTAWSDRLGAINTLLKGEFGRPTGHTEVQTYGILPSLEMNTYYIRRFEEQSRRIELLP